MMHIYFSAKSDREIHLQKQNTAIIMVMDDKGAFGLQI